MTERMELQHFSHQHLLVFQDPRQSIAAEEEARCQVCGELIDCPSYCCNECKVYIHKNCAELELAPTINHLAHPQHLLTLLSKSPSVFGIYFCFICGRFFGGVVYHCDPCSFDLHVNCALLQASTAENFPNYLHEHPLIFVQNNKKEFQRDCVGCTKSLSGPIYFCLDCYDFFHKECAELPLEINHPCDRIHPLTLCPNPPIHPEKCCCYLCKIKWRGFVYRCSPCKVELTLEDFFAPRTITAASHDHPWMLLSREMSFICDFCGTNGDRNPYVCSTCDLLFHKNCTSLPCNIMITRHHHVISHSLQQSQLENRKCRICYDEVNTRYGSYYCSTSDCNYIAHVNCATDKEIWDGKIILKIEDKMSKEASEDSMNLITNVIETRSIEGELVAAEIKHAYHHHNLILTFSGEIRDDNNCDGCMRPLSTPFYSCDQCKFFLHKNCAELPTRKRHPFHRHLTTLTQEDRDDPYCDCDACGRHHQGFNYKCQEGCGFRIDIQCSLLSDTLKHPTHDHPLFLAHNYEGKCNGCLKQIRSLAYRCIEHCDFTLDLRCATLPPTAWYKYDKHPLNLTYFVDSDPPQHYCDLCEKERDPNHLFYYCADCDNSLHSQCALGKSSFLKLGWELKHYWLHPQHPLTVVKKIWNCPRCERCDELCYGQTLQCKESECNFSIHWTCLY